MCFCIDFKEMHKTETISCPKSLAETVGCLRHKYAVEFLCMFSVKRSALDTKQKEAASKLPGNYDKLNLYHQYLKKQFRVQKAKERIPVSYTSNMEVAR